MRKLLRSLLPSAIVASCVVGLALAQTAIQLEAITGPHMPTGEKLNLMINAINNVQGNGTAGAVAATTLTASGKVSSTGTGADSGILCPTFYTIGAPAAATDSVFFVATRAYRVVAVSEVHAIAAGGASVIQVTKDTSTNAPGAGTDLLTNNSSTGFNLNATANTVQVGTLVATAGVTSLAAGDRLAVDFANAIQSSSGIAITACLAPI